MNPLILLLVSFLLLPFSVAEETVELRNGQLTSVDSSEEKTYVYRLNIQQEVGGLHLDISSLSKGLAISIQSCPKAECTEDEEDFLSELSEPIYQHFDVTGINHIIIRVAARLGNSFEFRFWNAAATYSAVPVTVASGSTAFYFDHVICEKNQKVTVGVKDIHGHLAVYVDPGSETPSYEVDINPDSVATLPDKLFQGHLGLSLFSITMNTAMQADGSVNITSLNDPVKLVDQPAADFVYDYPRCHDIFRIDKTKVTQRKLLVVAVPSDRENHTPFRLNYNSNMPVVLSHTVHSDLSGTGVLEIDAERLQYATDPVIAIGPEAPSADYDGKQYNKLPYILHAAYDFRVLPLYTSTTQGAFVWSNPTAHRFNAFVTTDIIGEDDALASSFGFLAYAMAGQTDLPLTLYAMNQYSVDSSGAPHVPVMPLSSDPFAHKAKSQRIGEREIVQLNHSSSDSDFMPYPSFWVSVETSAQATGDVQLVLRAARILRVTQMAVPRTVPSTSGSISYFSFLPSESDSSFFIRLTSTQSSSFNIYVSQQVLLPNSGFNQWSKMSRDAESVDMVVTGYNPGQMVYIAVESTSTSAGTSQLAIFPGAPSEYVQRNTITRHNFAPDDRVLYRLDLSGFHDADMLQVGALIESDGFEKIVDKCSAGNHDLQIVGTLTGENLLKRVFSIHNDWVNAHYMAAMPGNAQTMVVELRVNNFDATKPGCAGLTIPVETTLFIASEATTVRSTQLQVTHDTEFVMMNRAHLAFYSIQAQAEDLTDKLRIELLSRDVDHTIMMLTPDEPTQSVCISSAESDYNPENLLRIHYTHQEDTAYPVITFRLTQMNEGRLGYTTTRLVGKSAVDYAFHLPVLNQGGAVKAVLKMQNVAPWTNGSQPTDVTVVCLGSAPIETDRDCDILGPVELRVDSTEILTTVENFDRSALEYVYAEIWAAGSHRETTRLLNFHLSLVISGESGAWGQLKARSVADLMLMPDQFIGIQWIVKGSGTESLSESENEQETLDIPTPVAPSADGFAVYIQPELNTEFDRSDLLHTTFTGYYVIGNDEIVPPTTSARYTVSQGGLVVNVAEEDVKRLSQATTDTTLTIYFSITRQADYGNDPLHMRAYAVRPGVLQLDSQYDIARGGSTPPFELDGASTVFQKLASPQMSLVTNRADFRVEFCRGTGDIQFDYLTPTLKEREETEDGSHWPLVAKGENGVVDVDFTHAISTATDVEAPEKLQYSSVYFSVTNSHAPPAGHVTVVVTPLSTIVQRPTTNKAVPALSYKSDRSVVVSFPAAQAMLGGEISYAIFVPSENENPRTVCGAMLGKKVVDWVPAHECTDKSGKVTLRIPSAAIHGIRKNQNIVVVAGTLFGGKSLHQIFQPVIFTGAHGMSGAAIAATVIVVTAAVIAGAVGVFFYLKKNRRPVKGYSAIDDVLQDRH